jgi:hypothetical protein
MGASKPPERKAKEMTKKELATQIAQHMNKVNSNVDIERMIKVLSKSMSIHELECCLRSYNR